MVTASKSPTSKITRIVWTVPSCTKPGVTYEVMADGPTATLRCNCPARTVCWHIKAVASGAIKSKPRVRVSQIPSTTTTPTVRRASVSDAGRTLAQSLEL